MSREELLRIIEDYLEGKANPPMKTLTDLYFRPEDLIIVLNELQKKYAFVYLSDELLFIFAKYGNIVEIDLAKYEVLFRKFDEIEGVFHAYY